MYIVISFVMFLIVCYLWWIWYFLMYFCFSYLIHEMIIECSSNHGDTSWHSIRQECIGNSHSAQIEQVDKVGVQSEDSVDTNRNLHDLLDGRGDTSSRDDQCIETSIIPHCISLSSQLLQSSKGSEGLHCRVGLTLVQDASGDRMDVISSGVVEFSDGRKSLRNPRTIIQNSSSFNLSNKRKDIRMNKKNEGY